MNSRQGSEPLERRNASFARFGLTPDLSTKQYLESMRRAESPKDRKLIYSILASLPRRYRS